MKEVARLFQPFADKSSLERVSMKAITLIQTLLLQKPSKKSKMKDHIILQSQGLTTRDVLRDKHPPGKPAFPESLLPDSSETINPIIYSNLAYYRQPGIPRVLLPSLALTHMLGGDCALHSSLPLMTCAMPLLLWAGEFAPLTFILMISVLLSPAG